jgi:hypothetical protein
MTVAQFIHMKIFLCSFSHGKSSTFVSSKNPLIAELAGNEEEASLEDANGIGHRQRVKVFDAHLRHNVPVRLQCHLEHVALLRLDQEEVHGLCFVGGGAHNHNRAFAFVQIILKK